MPELSSLDEFYFQWHITERCNRHCVHCYQNEERSPDLPLAELELILARMNEALLKWDRLGSLSFTGGEPLLRKEDLFALMERVDGMPAFAYYDLLTNGSLISDELAASLKGRRKLRRVQVSLEGANREMNDSIRGTGAFDETVAAIRRMKRQGLVVSVMTTISRLNFREFGALADLLSEEGVDYLSLERLVPGGHGASMKGLMLAPEELKTLYEQVYELSLRKEGVRVLTYRPLFALVAPEDDNTGALCSVGTNALTIMPNGDVYPCRRLPIRIGNVLSDGLYAIWYDSELLWKIRNPESLKGKCRTCSLLARCRGCRAMAYACSGDYLAEDPQCWS